METVEIWKDIPGYEGIYQVSNLGRIWSKKMAISMKLTNDRGYLRVMLIREPKSGEYNSVQVHRAVCMAFIPNPENKPQVNHKNRIRSDNRLENLEWVTSSENNTHSYAGPHSKKVPVILIKDTAIIELSSLAEAMRMLGYKSQKSIKQVNKIKPRLIKGFEVYFLPNNH